MVQPAIASSRRPAYSTFEASADIRAAAPSPRARSAILSINESNDETTCDAVLCAVRWEMEGGASGVRDSQRCVFVAFRIATYMLKKVGSRISSPPFHASQPPQEIGVLPLENASFYQ